MNVIQAIAVALILSIAAYAAPPADNEPPANVQAYLDKIKMTPTQAKMERKELIAQLQSRIQSATDDIARARDSNNAKELTEARERCKELRDMVTKTYAAPLPTVTSMPQYISVNPKVGDVGEVQTDADLVDMPIHNRFLARVTVRSEQGLPRRGAETDAYYWIEVCDLCGTGDRRELGNSRLMEVVGTRTYPTSDGKERAAPLLRPIDISKWLPKSAATR